MLSAKDFLDAINLLIDKKLEKTAQIYTCIVTSVNTTTKKCTVTMGGVSINVQYYGNAPTPKKAYRVFVPQGNTSDAFIIN